MKERLAAGDAWEDGDLVFCDEVGRPLQLRHVRWHFHQFCKKAGLPAGLTLYGLRHSCASLLLAAGVNAKVIQERLGHADVGLTLGMYSHVQPRMQQQAAERPGGVGEVSRDKHSDVAAFVRSATPEEIERRILAAEIHVQRQEQLLDRMAAFLRAP